MVDANRPGSWLRAPGSRSTARFFWAVTICLLSIPFESFQTHTHWDKIGWIPFYSWPVRPLDVLANVALYIPLGYLAATKTRKHEDVAVTSRPDLPPPQMLRRTRRSLGEGGQVGRAFGRIYVRVGTEAFLLSLTMEVIQDFSHSRFPSATDLVCNVAGALVGVALANRR